MRFSALPNHFKQLLLSIFDSQVQKLYHSLLYLALYVWLFLYSAFPEVTDNMLTVGNAQHLTQTLWERMYKNTFSTSLSVNLQPNVLRTNSNLLLSVTELKIHPWEKCLQSSFRFCFKQANDENKLAKGVQRQKEPVELQKPSGGKVSSLAHLQGCGRRQEWFL